MSGHEEWSAGSPERAAATEAEAPGRGPGSDDLPPHPPRGARGAGLEYYPVKNLGASLAGGDALLLVEISKLLASR